MLPTPWTVQLITPNDSTDYDDFGNPVSAAPTTTDVAVYGWSPAGTFETVNGVQSQTTADLDLFAPAFPATSRSQVVVDGEKFDIEGRIEDYNHGPFGFAPGVRVRLKKVTG